MKTQDKHQIDINTQSCQMAVSGSTFLDNVKTSDEFLQFIKDNKITYKKLKEVIFGNRAIEVIGCCKNYGQEFFEKLIEDHMQWYNVKYAIKKLVE